MVFSDGYAFKLQGILIKGLFAIPARIYIIRTIYVRTKLLELEWWKNLNNVTFYLEIKFNIITQRQMPE